MRIDRLLEIVILLINNDSMTGRQLASKFDVSLRTIQRDITALSIAGIPVTATTGVHGCYSILDNFKMSNNFVKKDDFTLIIMALKTLSTSYENRRLDQILDKYQSVSDGYVLPIHLDYSVTKEGNKIQHNNKILETCIENHNQVFFQYQNPQGDQTKRTVNPLILHFKWYSWYLFAFDLDKQDYRTFKVARMYDVSMSRRSFEHTADVYDLLRQHEQDYYKNCEHILVRCSSKALILLEENFPDAGFTRESEQFWIMDLHVPPTEPLWQSLLIGLGNQVEIIAPLHYRDKLIETAKKFISNYDT